MGGFGFAYGLGAGIVNETYRTVAPDFSSKTGLRRYGLSAFLTGIGAIVPGGIDYVEHSFGAPIPEVLTDDAGVIIGYAAGYTAGTKLMDELTENSVVTLEEAYKDAVDADFYEEMVEDGLNERYSPAKLSSCTTCLKACSS